MNLNDHTLLAYLDGELDDAQCAAVEAACAEQPALAQRLDQLALSDERVRRSYQAVLEEPVPLSLIAAILSAPDPRGRRSNASRRGRSTASPWPRWTTWLAPLWASWGGRGAAAFASVALLALGAVVAWTLHPGPDPGWALKAGEPLQDRSLLVALETAPSGREVEAAGRQFQILASFEHTQGGFCREFNASENGDDPADHLGVACRTGQGHWELVVLATENRPADPQHGGYRTASERQFEVVDGWRLAHTQGQPMEPAQERALIDRGWRP
jgi:hypothetical protein